MNSDLTMALVVITALSFDFTNGFHDTGNAMATSIATGALPPRVAVLISGALNLVGAFLLRASWEDEQIYFGNVSGVVEAGICFAIVLAAIGLGIYWIVST